MWRLCPDLTYHKTGTKTRLKNWTQRDRSACRHKLHDEKWRVNNSGWSKSTTCSQRLSGRCTEKQTKKQRKTVCYLQHTVSPSSSEDFSRDLCAATSGASSAAAFTSAFASSAGAAGSATGLHQTQSFMQNGIAYVSSHECKSGGVK